MMKNLFIGLGVLAMIAATSCKKDYTCECTFDGGVTSAATYEKVSKSDAEDKCSASNTAAILVDGKCELK